MSKMEQMKERFQRLSIKWKIFSYLLIFCLALLALLWFLQVVFLDNFYQYIKTNEIKASAAAIIKNIDSENLDELAQEVARNYNTCVRIIKEEDDRDMGNAHMLWECVIHKMHPTEREQLFLTTAQNKGELITTQFQQITRKYGATTEPAQIAPPAKERNRTEPPSKSDTEPEKAIMLFSSRMERERTMVLSKIVESKSGEIFHVMVNSVISPVNTTVTTIRVQLYFITGFMLLFSVLLAMFIAKKVSKPIEDINESAKILATGKYDIAFQGEGYKEITELSDTLNYTAKELYKVESLRQELIANISHDLRTPLTLIAGYAEAMRDLPNENTKENAQVIVDESMRLTTLVNDAMDISKLQSGITAPTLVEFSLTACISDTINRIGELMKKDGYTIEFLYDDEVIVTADEIKITQAFYNLLINAVNYTGADKVITIRQISTEDSVRIEVADTGEGIDPESLPYIWDRYYKVDKTHKRPVTGTGLGLSIVKSIVAMHDGEYGVTSQEGEGSVFWFSLKR